MQRCIGLVLGMITRGAQAQLTIFAVDERRVLLVTHRAPPPVPTRAQLKEDRSILLSRMTKQEPNHRNATENPTNGEHARIQQIGLLLLADL
jgi:hypothetical protein